jgi:O-antigen ligase
MEATIDQTIYAAVPPPPAPRAERLALRVLQLGAIAVVLASSTLNVFELDRFFVPKELVLHATAFLAALLAWRALGRMRTSRLDCVRVDRLLATYLLIGALSAALATNRWLAFRALAISASSALLFWVARALAHSSSETVHSLLKGLAFAVVLVAATSLLQAYGVEITLFSLNRAPGGTLGNRNFVAHAAAFGLPLVLLAALRARERGSFLRWSAGLAAVAASLVLTRSRAAWLAAGVVLLVTFASILLARPLRRDGRTWRRLALIVLLAAAVGAAALVIPNALRWRSDNPYLESVRRVADYQGGSGHGRLVQYGQSLRMAAHHPLLGVGPGNWPVQYPAYAVRHDPSLSDSEEGATSNPWPSSDWVAILSERGLAALLLLALVFLAITRGALRQLVAAPDADAALLAMALLGTLAGAAVTGLLDAVLLLALPAFLVWTALGVLWAPVESNAPPPSNVLGRVVLLAALAVAGAGAARSVAQLTAMTIYANHGDRASLAHAARIDPGNYRLRLRLARLGGRQRCEHARAARGLFPHAGAAREVSRGCK